MALKLFTFRGRFTGKVYYGTGHTLFQAAKEIGISHQRLILERAEVVPISTMKEASHVSPNQPSPN